MFSGIQRCAGVRLRYGGDTLPWSSSKQLDGNERKGRANGAWEETLRYSSHKEDEQTRRKKERKKKKDSGVCVWRKVDKKKTVKDCSDCVRGKRHRL